LTFSKLLFKYLDYFGLTKEDLADLLMKDVKVLQNDLISYIIKLKEEGYSYASMDLRLTAINTFFSMNDIIINKKRISRYLGEHIKTVKDRAYTIEEIKRMVDASDIKFKVFITLMASTGCRVGAIPPLKLQNLKYYSNERLYQITFYENTKDEYYSFTTPECAIYIKEYLQYRERCGEKLTDKSPLIRDDFIIDDLLHIENPRHLTVNTLNYYLRNILIKIGIRKVIPLTESGSKKKERKNVAQNHGFRKFTHTTMANKLINPEIREMLLGHSIGLSDSYYRPSEFQLLQEYLKVVNDLTINNEFRLSKQVQQLKEKNEDSEYIIKGRLQEKEEQIKKLEESVGFLADKFNAFLASQPGNKILYDDDDGRQPGLVKGIELKPEINNKAVGKVISSSISTSTNNRSNKKK
jgi:integrase